jgi:hypothetical protein
MYNTGYDDMFFTLHFINGLKEDIRGSILSQLPESVDRASMLAKIQQQILERQKSKTSRVHTSKASSTFVRQETSQQPTSSLWKERQLRDYRRANNLCYLCGEKFDAGHLQKCTKRNKP